MLTARFQPKLQAATHSRRAAARRPLHVVAFKNGDEEQAVSQDASKAMVTFQLPLHVEWGQEVALVGAAESLGAWDVEKSIPMSWNDGDFWTAQAELPTDTPIEYKYIIRAGDGEVKAVVQWQPCNNLELQAAGEQVELTIRDAWEGEQHDVLPGTLPLPTPPAPEEPQLEPEAALASEAAPAAPITEAPAPEPPVATKAASPEPVAVLETPAPAPAVVAEAPVAPATPVSAAKEERKPESAAAAVAASNSRRRTTSRAVNGSKPAGGNSSRANNVVAVTATEGAPQVKYGSLSTTELKEVCKERGLSTKGQRKDLLTRLQQLLGRNNNNA